MKTGQTGAHLSLPVAVCRRAQPACATCAMATLDPAYEFDAPRFYDFRRDDEGTSFASRWFDAQDDEQGAAEHSLRSCIVQLRE